MTSEIIENALIDRLCRGFGRSPQQRNRPHESDAELVDLPEGLLAVTMDGVAEEIEVGLYADPWLIGWMTVMVNASDLAAVGAEPVGILLNETLPRDADERFLTELQRGIREACETCGLHVLGGDTNHAARLHMSACALGRIPGNRAVTRSGCRSGDVLYASGPLGLGSAYAFSRLVLKETVSVAFRPVARLREGRILRGHASACMDTSDGVIATLDQLFRTNAIGFDVEVALERVLHEEALAVSREHGLPPWMMLAGPHGEFELVFTVPPGVEGEMLAAAGEAGWVPLRLGLAVKDPGIRISLNGAMIPIDSARVRNALFHGEGSIDDLLREFGQIDDDLQSRVEQ